MVTTVIRAKRRQALSKFTKDREDLQPVKCPAGTFFCDGHLDFLPLEKQSRDKRYCHECLKVIEDSTPPVNKDYWIPGKGIQIIDSKGYSITPDLRTVCCGTEQEILARIGCRAAPSDAVAEEKALQNPQPPKDTSPQKVLEKKPKSKHTQKVLQNPPPRVKTPGGRPQKNLPAAEILKLHRQGLGTRTIAKQFSTDKVPVSHVTIHRIIKTEEQKEKGQLELPLEGS